MKIYIKIKIKIRGQLSKLVEFELDTVVNIHVCISHSINLIIRNPINKDCSDLVGYDA